MITRYIYKKYLSLTLGMWLIREGLVVLDWVLAVLSRRLVVMLASRDSQLPRTTLMPAEEERP